ncbi:hypothetical protein [Actinopolymorpha pittospori]|uniref:Uncharacterized protein n=1 Tax=Actinopolymorpha pittospori TaxID=648752 RepID=A0A927MQF8_9ACTN|nr:hypothetical protein [Actinopolymorpha pittospori]MBE1604794.1 hypothetical protein [Actinopolymorpha pittospori]
MRAEHVDHLVDGLQALLATVGQPVLAAWNAKEDLLDLLAKARTRPDRTTFSHLLRLFDQRCAATHPTQLHRLATAVDLDAARGAGACAQCRDVDRVLSRISLP